MKAPSWFSNGTLMYYNMNNQMCPYQTFFKWKGGNQRHFGI